MQQLLMCAKVEEMPIFAPDNCLDQFAVIDQYQSWTWREIHTASIELAHKLDGVEFVCNLCGSYLSFLITWIASLRLGLVQILPPSRGGADLENSLSLSIAKTIVVTDVVQGLPTNLMHCKELLFKPVISKNFYSNEQLFWSQDLDFPLVTLYTSGSTGSPEAQSKTLSQLIIGAESLGKRLNEYLIIKAKLDNTNTNANSTFDRVKYLVSSVAPQHMFGIEASVMLSLVYGKVVVNQRPLLPADIQNTFKLCGEGAMWATTPLHIRAIARSDSFIEKCSLVLSSTMPLSVEVAAATEALLYAPVIEVYGSTETGALATRRTSCENEWLLLDGARITVEHEKISASGKHFNSPQILKDSIEITNLNRFKLLGRNSDLIKIAGRRTTLSSLNFILQELVGLDDGVFFLPESFNCDERLCLIYVAKNLSREKIKYFLSTKIDPIFIPRTLIQVDKLPRNDNGKLTKRALELIFRERCVTRAVNE